MIGTNYRNTGDNFIGEIYRILYKCENDTKQSSLILKMAAQNMARREKFNLSAFFARETRVYKEVIFLNGILLKQKKNTKIERIRAF